MGGCREGRSLNAVRAFLLLGSPHVLVQPWRPCTRMAFQSQSWPCQTFIELSCCPITARPMEHPQIGADCHTYEGASAANWLEMKHSSPMTRTPMEASTPACVELH